MEDELRAVYSNCVGFDSVDSAEDFATYLDRCHVENDHAVPRLLPQNAHVQSAAPQAFVGRCWGAPFSMHFSV